MASHSSVPRLNLVRSNDGTGVLAAGPTAAPRRNAGRSTFGAAGSAAAALLVLACALGPAPGVPGARDATAGEADSGVERVVIANFLSDSRRYLGL